MEIKDLIGQSGICFEQDRDQCPIATWIVEAGEVLRVVVATSWASCSRRF
jgi:hypothetical protein